MGDISAGTFTDCQLICQQTWRRQSGNLIAEMGGVSNSGFTDCQLFHKQIYRRQSGNMLADVGVFLLADLLTIS